MHLHRLLDLIKTIGKQYVVWQEIFDNGLTVLPDTVIHVWKGGNNWPKEVYNITKAGLKTLLSSCWYLNYISYGEDWPKVSTDVLSVEYFKLNFYVHACYFTYPEC